VNKKVDLAQKHLINFRPWYASVFFFINSK